jgi:hypothetical protein
MKKSIIKKIIKEELESTFNSNNIFWEDELKDLPGLKMSDERFNESMELMNKGYNGNFFFEKDQMFQIKKLLPNSIILNHMAATGYPDEKKLMKLGFNKKSDSGRSGTNIYSGNNNNLELNLNQIFELLKVMNEGWAKYSNSISDYYKRRGPVDGIGNMD